MAADTASAKSDLSVASDHVERYRERVVALVPSLSGGSHDDAIAAIYEAERALRTATRALDRAVKLLR